MSKVAEVRAVDDYVVVVLPPDSVARAAIVLAAASEKAVVAVDQAERLLTAEEVALFFPYMADKPFFAEFDAFMRRYVMVAV